MGKSLRDIDISNSAKRLIDADYHLGPVDNAFDCLTILREFYGNLGLTLPPLPDGWTDDNYAQRWQNGEGREELYYYLLSIGTEVEPNYIIAGDLLIFDGKEWVFPGIYLGSGHFLAAFEKGVRVVPLKLFIHALVEAKRLQVGAG